MLPRPRRTMDDLLDDFLIETAERLPEAETALVAWEADSSRRDLLDAVFRAVHTIKGACGFLRLRRLEALTHAAETRLAAMRAAPGDATAGDATLVFRALDGVRDILGSLELLGVEPAGDDAALISELTGTTAEVDPVAFRVTARPPAPAPEAARGEAPAPAPPPPTAPPRVQACEPASPGVREHEPAPPAGAPSRADLSVRVNVDVLDTLAAGVDELVRTRDQLLELLPTLRDGPLKAPLQRLSVITGELQDGVSRARLQPVGGAWRGLPRLVRDLSQALGKPVDLVVDGGSDLIDREVIEALRDPLIQLVRNSLDHGLETPPERLAAGKPRRGLLHLAAWLEGDGLAVRVTDDGRGLDGARIRQAAVAQGWLGAGDATALTDSQTNRLIFLPGFSTAETAGVTSGRGVGLDLVRTAAERLGGAIAVRSAPGRGAAITLRIPLARPASGGAPAEPEAPFVAGPRRVLLVEENAFFRHMMTPLLTAAGYEVTAAASADEAWRLHDAGSEFDAVVSDLDSGAGFARRAGEDSRWSAALRVALTDLPVGRIPVADGFAQVVRKSDREGLIAALSGSTGERAA